MAEDDGAAEETPVQPRRAPLAASLWRLLAAAWLSGALPAPPAPAPSEPPSASTEMPEEDGRR